MGDKIEFIESWKKNAEEWIRVVDAQEIPSRKYTNKAIVKTIAKLHGSKILDLGCGEGWLVREITNMGRTAVGLDAIAVLLENAQKKGPEPYYRMTYKEIIKGKTIPKAPFDIAVFNFCLYAKDGLTELLVQTKKALSKNGKIVIQTLHPFFLFQQNLEYKSQWLTDSWKGLPGNFIEGHSWYARTLEDWISVINKSKMKIIGLSEVTDQDRLPVSIVLTLQQ